jgi:hypothetical protein
MEKLEKWILQTCQIMAMILPKIAESLRQPKSYFEKSKNASVGLIIP